MDVRKIFGARTFQLEVVIAFWLCIHLEKVELAQLVYGQDPVAEKILLNLKKSVRESNGGTDPYPSKKRGYLGGPTADNDSQSEKRGLDSVRGQSNKGGQVGLKPSLKRFEND